MYIHTYCNRHPRHHLPLRVNTCVSTQKYIHRIHTYTIHTYIHTIYLHVHTYILQSPPASPPAAPCHHICIYTDINRIYTHTIHTYNILTCTYTHIAIATRVTTCRSVSKDVSTGPSIPNAWFTTMKNKAPVRSWMAFCASSSSLE